MELSNLRPAEGSKHSDNFRRGRGHGSGNGKTAGKGHKGQLARSGHKKPGFEGGQMPLYRRLPSLTAIHRVNSHRKMRRIRSSFGVCRKNRFLMKTKMNRILRTAQKYRMFRQIWMIKKSRMIHHQKKRKKTTNRNHGMNILTV